MYRHIPTISWRAKPDSVCYDKLAGEACRGLLSRDPIAVI